jgi:catechol 2,3-dioxygenase-like lactoylglutathione lyase family enzyme
MTESLITHLRHVDLAVPDYDRQLDFYTGTWGLSPVASDTGITFLAAEGSPERYIIRLRRDPAKRLDLVSFGAASRQDVDALAERLISLDVTLAREPGDLATEGGGYGLRFFDLDGRTIEVSADVATRSHRKIEERESIPVRLSHVVLNGTDPDRTARWYSDTLGFRLSDTLAGEDMGTVMNFMRCNRRHHSLAFARGPHVSLHHVSFELRGIDEFMRGTGRVLRSGTRMVWGPGRHLAGSNTFAYFLDPSSNTVEYTTELAELDEDAWHPHIYDMHDDEVQDQWGTANPMNELVAKESFNDPDPGLFAAPPV